MRMTSISQLTRELQAPPLEALYLISAPSLPRQVLGPCPKSHSEDHGVNMLVWPTLTATSVLVWKLLAGNSGLALALRHPVSPLPNMATMVQDRVSQNALRSPLSSMTRALLSLKSQASSPPRPGSILPTWTVLRLCRERQPLRLPYQAHL